MRPPCFLYSFPLPSSPISPVFRCLDQSQNTFINIYNINGDGWFVCVCAETYCLNTFLYIPICSTFPLSGEEADSYQSANTKGKGAVGHGARQGGEEVEYLWEVAMWLWAVWPSGWRLRAVSPYLTVLCVCFSSSWLMACVSLTFYGLCVLKWMKWQLLVCKTEKRPYRPKGCFHKQKKKKHHSFLH